MSLLMSHGQVKAIHTGSSSATHELESLSPQNVA